LRTPLDSGRRLAPTGRGRPQGEVGQGAGGCRRFGLLLRIRCRPLRGC